jgi:hypothetical protein
MSALASTIAGCGLCKHVQYIGPEMGVSRCVHPDHAPTTVFAARMPSGHCGPSRSSFAPFTGDVPAMHSIPVKGGQS